MAGPTLDDIAQEVGVHPSTVSRALNPRKAFLVNPATRVKVEEVARSLGYRPDLVARGLQSGKTATVGMIVADLGNTFVTPIIHRLSTALEMEGVMPIIAETQDDHDRFSRILDHTISRRVDAVVTTATRAGDREILESAGKVVPVVIAARPLAGTSLPQVTHNDRAGAELVVEHLADLGHQRVGQLRGPLDIANFSERAIGFTDTCHRLGLKEIVTEVTGERPIFKEGQRVMRALLDDSDQIPTAVFAHNDLMALGALDVLREAGLAVPNDVSLVGYNDLPAMDLVDPPLTTVRYPSRQIGQAAGELILEVLAGEEPENVQLDARLVVRGSTKKV